MCSTRQGHSQNGRAPGCCPPNLEEFGQFCAFVCSSQASYFTGQNVLLDGGAYPGTY